MDSKEKSEFINNTHVENRKIRTSISRFFTILLSFLSVFLFSYSIYLFITIASTPWFALAVFSTSMWLSLFALGLYNGRKEEMAWKSPLLIGVLSFVLSIIALFLGIPINSLNIIVLGFCLWGAVLTIFLMRLFLKGISDGNKEVSGDKKIKLKHAFIRVFYSVLLIFLTEYSFYGIMINIPSGVFHWTFSLAIYSWLFLIAISLLVGIIGLWFVMKSTHRNYDLNKLKDHVKKLNDEVKKLSAALDKNIGNKTLNDLISNRPKLAKKIIQTATYILYFNKKIENTKINNIFLKKVENESEKYLNIGSALFGMSANIITVSWFSAIALIVLHFTAPYIFHFSTPLLLVVLFVTCIALIPLFISFLWANKNRISFYPFKEDLKKNPFTLAFLGKKHKKTINNVICGIYLIILLACIVFGGYGIWSAILLKSFQFTSLMVCYALILFAGISLFVLNIGVLIGLKKRSGYYCFYFGRILAKIACLGIAAILILNLTFPGTFGFLPIFPLAVSIGLLVAFAMLFFIIKSGPQLSFNWKKFSAKSRNDNNLGGDFLYALSYGFDCNVCQVKIKVTPIEAWHLIDDFLPRDPSGQSTTDSILADQLKEDESSYMSPNFIFEN